MIGLIILKERLNIYQRAALIFAAVGIIILIAAYGKVPWISLIRATSFGLYGLFKKMANVQPIIGITLETAFMLLISLIYIIFKQTNGSGCLISISISLFSTFLLFSSGATTAIPLLLFAQGTKK